MERRQFLKLAVEFAAGATALAVPFLQHPPIFFAVPRRWLDLM